MNDPRSVPMHPCRKAVLSTLVAALLVPTSLLAASANAAVPDHSLWERFLQQHVRAGRVDYAAVKRNPSGLDRYLEGLAKTRRREFYEASKNTRLAFWINAYNAYTIQLVVAHYPVTSIWDVTPVWKRPLGGPFVEEFIPLGHLFPGKPLARKLSLNDIEHEILRKEFHEPRVHFTIVCASRSCPTLNTHAYRAATLEHQLTAAARAFMRDASKNRYDATSNTLYLSEIFRWFGQDFQRDGSLIGFLRPYLDDGTLLRLSQVKTAPRIEFNSYDWSLNKQTETAQQKTASERQTHG